MDNSIDIIFHILTVLAVAFVFFLSYRRDRIMKDPERYNKMKQKAITKILKKITPKNKPLIISPSKKRENDRLLTELENDVML